MRINTYGRQYGWGLLRMLWFASLIHWMKNFAPISQPKPLTPKPITASRELVTRAFRCLDQTSAFDLISDGCRCYSTLARSRMSVSNVERFPYNRNFRKFGNSGKCYRNFSDKFPEIPKTVEFSKCDPFNWKLREKSWLERKLSGKFFVLCFGIFSDAVPLVTGSCRKFTLDVLVEWNTPKGRLPITKSFQKIRLKSKWNTACRVVSVENFRRATNNLKR